MSFSERVYVACKMIPKGKVSTYADIARFLNSAPRAVGQALKRNPYAPRVPCHRVVKSDGKIGGFMGAARGPQVGRKIGLLSEEGVEVKGGKVVDFPRVLFRF